jgi:5-methylcytosine-specific restriction endonuclease McrA
MKSCKECQTTSDDFGIDKSQKDGLNRLCRTCLRQRNKNYYLSKYRGYLLDAYHNKGGKTVKRLQYMANSLHFKLANRVYNNKKRAELYSTIESFTERDFLLVIERFENQCFNCGINGTERDLHVDHHMPRHLGFTLTHDNAVLLCDACNGTKNRQLPQEFYAPFMLEVLASVYGVVSHSKCTEEP